MALTHHLISARCGRMLRELISGQGNNRVGHSHARNAKQESEVKEASKYIFSSGVGKAFAKRRQRHNWKPRQGMQGSERVKKWPCSYFQKESSRSNRIAHERPSCCSRLPPLSLSINQQAKEQAPSAPETTVVNTKVPGIRRVSTSTNKTNVHFQ